MIGVVEEKQEGRIRIRNTMVTTAQEIPLGSKVLCKGNREKIHTNRNFYIWDYEKYLYSIGIFYEMEGNCEIMANPSLLYQWKESIQKYIESRKGKAYYQAFILGNKEGLSTEIKESYQKNGISHLFSLSGMHMGFFFLCYRKLFSKKKKRDIPFLVFSLFYLFLTDFPPSLIRASLFPYFSSITSQFGIQLLPSFILFTLLILSIFPYFIQNTGFLFSFMISFFLIYIFSKKNKMTLLELSIYIFLVSIPISIYTSFSFNVLSFLYNLIFIPLVTFFLFPFSFLSLFFPILEPFYLLLLSMFEKGSLFLSNLPTVIYFPHLSIVGIIGYYLLFLFVIHKMLQKEYKYIVILIVFLMIHFISPILNPKATILMLDVGQGDSILIIFPHQSTTILVDTGGIYGSSIAKNILLPTLHAYGIRKLDYLILTHGDLDHMNEAISLLELFPVRQVIMNSGSLTNLEQELLSYMEKQGIPHEELSHGVIQRKKGNLYFLNTRRSENENEDSLVLYLQLYGKNILLMGDSGFLTEKYLLEEYNLPKIDILKVGHHGSKNSTSLEFAEKINPSICLISSGYQNRFGHPHPETLNRLQNCKRYLTSIEGATKISLGSSMHVTTAR